MATDQGHPGVVTLGVEWRPTTSCVIQFLGGSWIEPCLGLVIGKVISLRGATVCRLVGLDGMARQFFVQGLRRSRSTRNM